ncbi:glycerol-3-phosphate acyltransferase 1, mitochondrial-like isoform X2 [Dysidea avara]|uniref:glycerol-3-phosphate acyltransferase 1, mitochondrial-like isoform X2 n=1 Tax=Dysidea avara TaxID=196820 RepID=UPI003321912F
MEGDYRSRVDGIFKKFGKSPSSSQNSILKRSAVGSEEKRSPQRTPGTRLDRRSQRSKKPTTDCYVPSLTVDLGTLPQISTSFAPAMARCCEKCLPTSRTRFYDNSFANMPTMDVLRIVKGNWLTHWWMVLQHCWNAKLDYNIPGTGIHQSVLQSERVDNAVTYCSQEAIEETKKNTGEELSTEKTMASQRSRAKSIIRTMAAVIYKRLFRVAGIVLHGVFGFVFKGLHYDQGQLEMLRKVSTECNKNGYPVVFLPTHKSHLDYIILSFLLVNLEVKVPHIAAGDNLNITGFAWLQRHLGGFFIKRKLDTAARKDVLYRKVLHEYLEQLLKKGQYVEFFVEGSRTRTGKPSIPKGGLVSVLVDTVMEGVVNDIYIVPVNISYDKILEGNFHHELMGGAKKMETLWRAISGMWRMLTTKLGHIRVDFAQPFSLQEYLQTCSISDPLMLLGSGLSINSYSEEEARTRQLVTALGRHVVNDFTRCGSLMSTSMVSFLLLTKFRSGVTLSQLVAGYQWMIQEAGSRGRRAEYCGSTEAAVRHALQYMRDLVVTSRDQQQELTIVPVLKLPTVMGLTQLSNQSIHVFLMESIIACSVNSILGGSPAVVGNGTVIFQEELKEAATQLCIILAREFIFAPPCQHMDTTIQGAIDMMTNSGVFHHREMTMLTNRQRSLTFMADDEDDEEQYTDVQLEISASQESSQHLSFLQNILEPYLEAYWLTGTQLLELKDHTCKESQFLDKMRSCLLDRSEKGLAYFAESCCMEMCKNAVRRFSEMNILKLDGVEPSPRTLKLVNHDQLVELVNDMESYRQ